jgi:hypothetical protein
LARTDLTTQIGRAVNRAIHYYSNTEFYFNQNVWGFKLPSGVESITFASASISDASHIQLVNIIKTSSYNWVATPVPLSEIRDMNTTGLSNTGEPYLYAVFKDSLYFYAVPNVTYSVDVYGLIRMQALSASGDTNSFLVQAEDLIENRAAWDLYSRILKDPDNAAVAKQNELEALSTLQGKTTTLQSSRRLAAHD